MSTVRLPRSPGWNDRHRAVGLGSIATAGVGGGAGGESAGAAGIYRWIWQPHRADRATPARSAARRAADADRSLPVAQRPTDLQTRSGGADGADGHAAAGHPRA